MLTQSVNNMSVQHFFNIHQELKQEKQDPAKFLKLTLMPPKSKNDLGLNFHDHTEFLKYWHLTGPKLFVSMEEYHKEWE